MTATDVRNMPAGPALDALIAEKVMGWNLIDRVAAGWGDGPAVWETGEDRDDPDSSPTFQDFRPSSEPGHAWKVAEVLRKRFNLEIASATILQRKTGGQDAGRVSAWRVEIDDMEFSGARAGVTETRTTTEVEATATTFPLALCRAALLAVAAGA